MIEVTEETTKVEGNIFSVVRVLLYLGRCLKGCITTDFHKKMILMAIDTMKEIIQDAENNPCD